MSNNRIVSSINNSISCTFTIWENIFKYFFVHSLLKVIVTILGFKWNIYMQLVCKHDEKNDTQRRSNFEMNREIQRSRLLCI